MLKVIVELHPFGDSVQKKVIDELYIGNVGMSGPNESNYHFWINKDPRGTIPRIKPTGKVEKFDRERGAIELIYECVKSMKPKRKKK